METIKDDENWYQELFLWIDPSEPWDILLYDMVTNNKFDVISNTMGKGVWDDDQSDWAVKSLNKCFILLWGKKLGPDYLNHPKDPKTRIGWRFNRLLFWLYLVGPVKKYGHQRRMSRDPYVNFFTNCTRFDKYRKIELITIPWYLYRPNTWAWRKYLITGKKWDLQVYNCLNWIGRLIISKKDYVGRLETLRRIGIKNKQAWLQREKLKNL